ncbi:3-oxoacyl-ACP reductase family protein [Paraflavitalea sp. CAU 1676]|uniref:SDR family NAD(P)-dependent oxidoreductase n=1 Tax=Paraflavitalea sp. CAU 1676 TaxID=3032598 RepID=UPI0023DC0778|nr:3-oxoacyl-ACP reductase family protein [Paraflavitalea sp. CAU 1676]MDF2190457.1 3-oxoacyl-ACP reductase FabG [Paraflavitalea sp. CAU 1676]
MKRLENKVALVTGGSRGIGAGIVKRLAAEGAKVAFTYAQSAQAAAEVLAVTEAAGSKAIAIVADNHSTDALPRAVEETVKTFGRIDILVNNAGMFSLNTIEDYSLQEYDDMMNVNVRAVFLASQAAARHMQAGSRIITIGSNMADRVSDSHGALYAMSKSALIGLNKGIARDLGPKGITVNLVQPGPIDTDMNPASAPHAEGLRSRMAIPKYGTPAQIAGLVAYLASEESGFMTGTALTMDGGYNI